MERRPFDLPTPRRAQSGGSLSNLTGEELKVQANGVAAARVAGVKNPALFAFAREIAPGELPEFTADWSQNCEPVQDGHCMATSAWYPRLWWGYESLADYEAKVEAPAGIVVLIAGLRTNGVFEASRTRALGLAVARGLETESADGAGVTVTAIFTKKGSDCAHMVLKTAADAIGFFHRNRTALATFPLISLGPLAQPFPIPVIPENRFPVIAPARPRIGGVLISLPTMPTKRSPTFAPATSNGRRFLCPEHSGFWLLGSRSGFTP